MKLSVYSLQQILFEGSAKSLNCKTSMGEITVLDHHEPLIAVLTKGVIKIVDAENKEHFFPVASGFLEVKSQNQARCMVE